MKKTTRQYMAIVLAAWTMIALPGEAMAYTLLYCNTSGGTPAPGSQLFFTGTGTGTGPAANTVGFCERQGQIEYIFSQLACNFTIILNDVLGRLYCSMQSRLKGVLSILISLYIAVLGAQILMGTAKLTAKETVVRLLKIAGVWTFVSQADWGVGLAFKFFLDLANQGVVWVLSAINNPDIQTSVSAEGGVSDIMPMYEYLDRMVYQVVTGPLLAANSKLIGFFMVMSYIVPPIFMIAVYWLWTTFTILARTLISFLMCLAAIAFLISLSPIFLSFMLFRTTYTFFDSWLKFLISYTLQIIIVFACVTMWTMVIGNFTGFFDDLSDVIHPYQKVWRQAAPISDPTDSWGICPYRTSSNALGPTIECIDGGFNPITDPNDHEAIIGLSDVGQQGGDSAQTALAPLIYFVVYHLITLIIICYAFDALLKKAPEIAKHLAGPEYVPILGEGWGDTGFGRGKGAAGRMFRPYYGDTQAGQGSMLQGLLGGKGRAGAVQGLVGNINRQVQTSGGRRP